MEDISNSNYIAYSAIFTSLTVTSLLLTWYCFGYFEKILKGGLQKYVYPPATTDDLETENAFPPVDVMLEVHKNVIFFENPTIARWDAEGTAMPLTSFDYYVMKKDRLI